MRQIFSVCVALSAIVIASLVSGAFFSTSSSAGTVQIQNNQLFVDGEGQPQLYGAELQYFRLRGGNGRNVPREKVIALWNAALDRMVEAKMNAISFYIPWDFHEYAEGKFDFTGTADEDGDGNPDYPSRDVTTFLKLIEQHGIKHIMVRPGPYVNAEWGFLGFGAVPLWFHEKYPQSHMQNSAGEFTKLYDYQNADFRRHSELWIREVYNQVLNRYIGPGKPIDFVQLDNETNYMWQSLYNHDYSATAKERYREYLKSKYVTLEALNSALHHSFSTWDEITPPTQPGVNIADDQEWYRFHDESIHEYLGFVRTIWESLGVREPQVLFTLAESYNATKDGLLPNYALRNDPGVTGMMTVNLYPKTYETDDHPLLNNPFKADHDVKAADEATDHYLGHREEWVLGPEIQGGWWRGVPVSPQARKQTFLTVLGHGLKATFIYYFNEGNNWQTDWMRQQMLPYFDALKAQPKYREIPDVALPWEFWNELQAQTDRSVIVGIDVRGAYFQDAAQAANLYFDAPLDGNAKPQKNYALVKEIGEKLIGPYQNFLAKAVEMTDPVCFLKDVSQHVPSDVSGIDSVKMNSDWAAGLVGYLMQTGINPQIIHWGLSPDSSLDHCKMIILQDNGIFSKEQIAKLKQLITNGAMVVNFLDDSRARALGFDFAKEAISATQAVKLYFQGGTFDAAPAPLFKYSLAPNAACASVLRQGLSVTSPVVSYRCKLGKGSFVQIGALFYDAFNADFYGALQDVPTRRAVFESLLSAQGITPRVQIVEGGDRVVAFGRTSPSGRHFWITVKSARLSEVSFRLRLSDVSAGKRYRVKDLFTAQTFEMSGKALSQEGFLATLPAEESTVYFIEETQ
jgi:hypothetical protein